VGHRPSRENRAHVDGVGRGSTRGDTIRPDTPDTADTRSGRLQPLCDWLAPERGVKLNLADYDGRTALYLAASEGHQNVVEALLVRGVGVDPVDRWGNTPLDDALRGGRAAVVAALEVAGGRRVYEVLKYP
jgi:hypothetical protein